MKKLLIVFLFVLGISYGRGVLSGNCEQGGQRSLVAGFQTSTYVQASYPVCQVAVYLQGTNTLATLFADNFSTPLANPFNADNTGYWFFYADPNNFQINLTGTGIFPSPLIRFMSIFSGGGSTSIFQVNGSNLTNQSPVNFQNASPFNGVTLSFTNPSFGNIQPVFAGTFSNAALANSSVTVNTTSPLLGGGAVALGGTLTLTCPTCSAGGGPGAPMNSLQKNNGSGGFAGSSVIDNGIVVATTEPFETGASPPACSGGTAGGFCYTEGTDITGTVAEGHMNPNAADHHWHYNNNNAGVFIVPGETAAITAGHLWAAAANGIDMVDGGTGGGGGTVTYWQNYGYDTSATFTASANATVCTAVIMPTALSVGHIGFYILTIDNTNNSDIGLYNTSGTLVAHIGAQHLGTANANNIAFSGGTQSIPAGKNYLCVTSAASTLQIEGLFAGYAAFYGNVSATTSGGALNGSITPPADAPVFTGTAIPAVVLIP